MYQYQFAPAPRLPPERLNVLGDPGQIEGGVAVADEGATEDDDTTTVTLTQAVELQELSALT